MRTLVILAALALFLGAAPGAWAEPEFDMRRVTCDEVETRAEAETAAIWLDGYLAARTGDTVTSSGWIAALYAYVAAECRRRPHATILSIVESNRR